MLRAGIKVKALAYLLALAFLFSIAITAAGAIEKDTYLVSGSPNQNFGADTTMDVKGDDNRRTLIEFDTSYIPSTAVIQTAILQLYVTTKGTGTPTVNTYRINNSWTEGTGTGAVTNNGATWNTKNGTTNWNTAGGDYEPTVHANATLAAKDTWYSWDITSLVQAWVNGTYPNYGILLRDVTASTGTWTFASSNNSNTSQRPKLNISYSNYTESTAPSINSAPTAGTIHNQSNTINISTNITDNYQLSTVSINLTYPNSSTQQIMLTNTSPDIFYTLFSETNQTGTYTVQIIANDTFGNTNSTATTFVIQDITAPLVTNVQPAAGINYTQNAQINISANTIDRYANNINIVYANITKPDGAIVRANMTNTGGDTYTASFTDTSEAGTYTVQIIANDATGNINSTETTWFSAINNTVPVTDTTLPVVLNIIPLAGTNISMNITVNITVNVTDDTAVDTVFANITKPNLSTTLLQLYDDNSDSTYNNSITTNQPGRYHITIIANDTSGNTNNTEQTQFNSINSTPTNTSNITPTDAIPPAVLNITPLAGTNFSINSIVDITVKVTDDTAVDTVFANITKPDLSAVLLQLFDDDSDSVYNNSITANQQGWYHITIIANDTSGNTNSTETSNFDPASLGSAGGGGGGTAARAYQQIPFWRKKTDGTQIIRPGECIESWLCMPWNECSPDGYKTRTCTDYYQCGTNKTIPLIQIKCQKITKTTNTTIPKKESKAEQPRFAISPLLPPKQTATTISGAGLISVIILISISAYLLLKKKKTKRNKNPDRPEEESTIDTAEPAKNTTVPGPVIESNEASLVENIKENTNEKKPETKPKKKAKKKAGKPHKKTKLKKKK